MSENELSHEIIGEAIEVYKELGGPGLLEDIHEEALLYELQARNLRARRQMAFRVTYKGQELKKRLIIDLLVEERVIVECKAVDSYHAIFEAQLRTYLKQTNKR